MKSYLVGGAVRDALLGLPVKDRDWVVVGATPQQMLDAGYQQVGRDFPRVPPSAKPGRVCPGPHRAQIRRGLYRFYLPMPPPDVTLEADLLRRDLTVNALAQDADGAIIDPYGGQNDLRQRLLRHVSPRLVKIRCACCASRAFAARYAHLGFRIAEETQALMAAMVEAGELAHLTPERV